MLKPWIGTVDSCFVLWLSCISLCFSSSHRQYWKQSCSSYCFSSSHQQYLEHSCYELALTCIMWRKSLFSYFLIARCSRDKSRTFPLFFYFDHQSFLVHVLTLLSCFYKSIKLRSLPHNILRTISQLDARSCRCRHCLRLPRKNCFTEPATLGTAFYRYSDCRWQSRGKVEFPPTA